MSKNNLQISREEEIKVFHPPHFAPRVVNPVYCPALKDARVMFDDLNFEGTITSEGVEYSVGVVKSKGIPNLGAGVHVFRYKTTSGCTGEARVQIKEKLHYNIEARVVAQQQPGGGSLLLRPGGEFDVITADMVKPDARQYVPDTGSGTNQIVGMPNGFGIEIMIPYPESYSHIRQDFCPDPVVLTAGLRTIIPAPEIEKTGGDYSLPECNFDPQPQPQQLVFGTLPKDIDVFTGIKDIDGTLARYSTADGCVRTIEWIIDDTYTTTEKKAKRRRSDAVLATLSQVSCSITSPLSCPLCSDAEITVSTNALNPVMYAWTDIPVSYDNVRLGLPAGAYFLTVIEQGSDVAYSPFCIVSVVYTGPVVTIEGLDVSFPHGCYACAIVDVTINAPGAVTFALIDSSDPPIDSCLDWRLEGDNIFSIRVRSQTYIPYVCDGASIAVGDTFVYEPSTPGPVPPTVGEVVGALVCPLEEGGYAVSRPATIALTGVVGVPHLQSDALYEYENQGNGTFLVTLTSLLEATTIVLVDARVCRGFIFVDVEVDSAVGVCGQCGSVYLSCLGCDGVPYSNATCGFEVLAVVYDCIIVSNETVTEAVDEIVWCVDNNRQVTGNLAPYINETVVLPASDTLDMQFLQFDGIEAQSALTFLLNVDISETSIVRSPIATFSSGTLTGNMTLPGDVNIDGLSPNQQMNLQYCTIDGLTTLLPEGGNTLLLNWAYMTVGHTRVAANRTGATLQLLTTHIGTLELFLYGGLSRPLALSSNGGSTIELLVVYIPGGWANVSANNTDVNGTRIPPYWEIASSNATLNVACYYLVTYPSIVKSARGWYGGPTLNGTDLCTEFGGGVTPSQSQSYSHFKYEEAPFPEELKIFFIFFFVVSAISLVLVIFLYMKW